MQRLTPGVALPRQAGARPPVTAITLRAPLPLPRSLRSPPRWLQQGGVMRIAIDGIGAIENRFEAH